MGLLTGDIMQSGLRRETLWRRFIARIDQRFGRIAAELTPEEMNESELAGARFESYKAVRENTHPEDPIEPELVDSLSSSTWGDELRKTEVDFFLDMLKPSFSHEPMEYQAVIKRICEELQAMGVKEPSEAERSGAAPIITVADSGPTLENIEAVEYEQAAEEEIQEAPAASVPEPEPSEVPSASLHPAYGEFLPESELIETPLGSALLTALSGVSEFELQVGIHHGDTEGTENTEKSKSGKRG
jgi:hypothetical protein